MSRFGFKFQTSFTHVLPLTYSATGVLGHYGVL